VTKQGKQGFRAGARQHGRQAGQHVAQVGERVEAVTPAGGDQAEVDRRSPAARRLIHLFVAMQRHEPGAAKGTAG
jgi:hypothetical protein